jgi:hypothetical protein
MNNVKDVIKDTILKKYNLENIKSEFGLSVTSTVEDFTIIPIFGILTIRISVEVKTILLYIVSGKKIGVQLPKFFKA